MARSQATAVAQPRVLLTAEQTASLLNCHKITLWRWMKSIPDFPRPIRVSPGRIAFRESEVMAYIETRPRVDQSPHARK
jgi:predicted DNA-binding transcriptional regulator AlpA